MGGCRRSPEGERKATEACGGIFQGLDELRAQTKGSHRRCLVIRALRPATRRRCLVFRAIRPTTTRPCRANFFLQSPLRPSFSSASVLPLWIHSTEKNHLFVPLNVIVTGCSSLPSVPWSIKTSQGAIASVLPFRVYPHRSRQAAALFLFVSASRQSFLSRRLSRVVSLPLSLFHCLSPIVSLPLRFRQSSANFPPSVISRFISGSPRATLDHQLRYPYQLINIRLQHG